MYPENLFAISIYEIAFGLAKDSRKPHMQELCQKCNELGRLCTLSMEKSSKLDHPNDVVIKGLPLDITEPQLIEIFRPYGSILRAYLPELKPGFSNRMAFITFQNPESALQKFNEVSVPFYTQQRLLRL